MKSENRHNDFPEEDCLFSEATEAVFTSLDSADIDLESRKIVWPDGEMLTVAQTVQRIHLQTEIKLEDIENHVLGWLEVGYDPPDNLDENEMEILENKIDKWIEDYCAEKSL